MKVNLRYRSFFDNYSRERLAPLIVKNTSAATFFCLIFFSSLTFPFSDFNGGNVLEALKKDGAIDDVGDESSLVVRYMILSSKRWALLTSKTIISILMDNDDLELVVEPKAELVSKMVYLFAPGSHDGIAPVASALRSAIHESLQSLPLFCGAEYSETLSPAEIRSPLSPLSPEIKAVNPESLGGVGLMHETAATRATQELEELYSKGDPSLHEESVTGMQDSKEHNFSELFGSAPAASLPSDAGAGPQQDHQTATNADVLSSIFASAPQIQQSSQLPLLPDQGPFFSSPMHQPASADQEPHHEGVAMPSGSSVTSPSLQSTAAPASSSDMFILDGNAESGSNIFASQMMSPVLESAGMPALTTGTQSDIASPIDSLTSAQPSNQDFLNSMFHTVPSDGGAGLLHGSATDQEPFFERFGMPSGSSVTSPSLQSTAAPLLSQQISITASKPGDDGDGLFADLLTGLSGASSSHHNFDQGSSFVGHLPIDQSTSLLAGSSESQASNSSIGCPSDAILSTVAMEIVDSGVSSARSLAPFTVDPANPLNNQLPVSAFENLDSKDLVPHSSPPQPLLKVPDHSPSIKGIAAPDEVFASDFSSSIGSQVPVVSMDNLDLIPSFSPLSPPQSPLKNPDISPSLKSIAAPPIHSSADWDLVAHDDIRGVGSSSTKPGSRKHSAFESIGNFLSGFISKKADKDKDIVRRMSVVGFEQRPEDLLSQHSATSPPPQFHEPESKCEHEALSYNEHGSNFRQYQLIRMPISSAEKIASNVSAADLAAGAQQYEVSDVPTNDSKGSICKLSYEEVIDALCEQKQQPQLFIVVVCDSKTKQRDSGAIGSSIQSIVSESNVTGPPAQACASSVASSRATSPHPLVADPLFWRSHAFLDQNLVSQYISRPGFEQVEHDCAAKCSHFRWDKLDAEPSNEALNSKFREVVKYGIPMAFRRPIWLRLSGIKEEELPALQELYRNRLVAFLGESGPTRVIRYLPHFGQQILWEKAHLLNESGRNAAFRILTVVALAHQPKLAFFPMLQDLVGCLLCFLSESETFFVIDGLIKSEFARLETHDESFPIVLLSTASESLIAGFVIESLRHEMKDIALCISQATLDVDGKPSWDSASPYLWGMLQGWLRNIWVGHAPLDLAFRSVDLILMKAFDQLGLLKLAVLEHLSSALTTSASPRSGESNHGAGIMPMFKALNNISPTDIHGVAQRGLSELKINPSKALSRVTKSKILPPVPASPVPPQSGRAGKFLGDSLYYLPKPLPSSSIIKDEHFEFIWKHLPERFKATEDVRRVFNSREHGLSLTVCRTSHSLSQFSLLPSLFPLKHAAGTI